MTESVRHIAHLDLDTFFVSASRLQNPELVGRPVLVGGMSDRAVVSSCSYEARKFGIRAGMPMRAARQLCAEAVVIRGDMDWYQRKSNEVTQVIADTVPSFEKASVDEHYIDLTGMDRFFGVQKLMSELSKRIVHETGLPLTYGLSVNKTVAKMATNEAKQSYGWLVVPQTEVLPFLKPLPVQKMPGIGLKTADTLQRMGLRQLGALAALPRDVVLRVLGKNGITLWERANGIDNTPVFAEWQRKSIGAERTFETDTTDLGWLLDQIVHLAVKLCYQLRRKSRLATVISVKVRYSNFDTHTKQMRIRPTALDHEIVPVAKQLFEALYNRRLLVRLVGVKLDGLHYGYTQLDLFANKPQLPELYKAMDWIRNNYGSHAILRASSLSSANADEKRKTGSDELQNLPTNRLQRHSWMD